MSYEYKDGQFSLFINENHQPGDDRPAMKGKGMWGGQLLEFAVWSKTKQDGGKWLSGKIQQPQQKDGQRAPAKPESGARPSLKDEMSDEIPF